MLPTSVDPRAKMKTLPAHWPFFRSFSTAPDCRASSSATCSTGRALAMLSMASAVKSVNFMLVGMID